MSRILRRPMFRGGRVDSRGTGITSNLGYAGGGSVNTPKRGLVDGPGGYKGVSTTGGFGSSPFVRGGERIWDYGIAPWANPINQYLINPIAGLFGYGDLLPRVETPYDRKFLEGKATYTDKYKKKYVPDPIVHKMDSGAIPTAIKEQENEILLEKLEAEKLAKEDKSLEEIMKEMMGSKKTKKETIEEYKETFKDAYGSGRVDDASTMALSFAGKALKEGATVKSAFGEFFEDESKRPSEHKKYKDAATTAAINAFLTGEKDYDSMMKQMKIIDYQIDKKADAAKGAKEALSFVEIKAGLPQNMKDRERTKAAAELFVQYTDKGKTFTVIDEDEDTDALLKAPENEGQYFMNRETKQVFKILKGIKQFIYGG